MLYEYFFYFFDVQKCNKFNLLHFLKFDNNFGIANRKNTFEFNSISFLCGEILLFINTNQKHKSYVAIRVYEVIIKT